MQNKQIGIVLLVVGLVAVNAVYLGDLFAGEVVITLGTKSGIALVVANLIALAGLIALARSGGESPASGTESPPSGTESPASGSESPASGSESPASGSESSAER